MPMKLFVLALAARAAADKCPQYTSCHDCLNPRDPALDCGWCSPKPAVFSDGSPATQCMDHTSKGWTCFHLYMHDGCIAGYVCDHKNGKCVLGEPGQGDTKENCELSCHPPAPPPPPQFVCNVTTLQCQVGPSGGSATKEGCASACSNSTPADLLGVWRGLDVQTNFTTGEYVMNFTASAVTWGPLATPKMFAAHVATLSRTLVRLTMTAPAALAGDVRFAAYSTPGWPTGPETRAISIAIQREGSHQAPPHDTSFAMGDPSFDVYVMNACDSWKKQCSFRVAAPPPSAARAELVEEHVEEQRELEAFGKMLLSGPGGDKCTVHKSCDTCINDPLKVCGWCDGVITFGDGTTCGEDGNGCCGGSSGFSKCNLAYRKECPVVCDWTNWTNPTCRAATSKEIAKKTQTFADCDSIASWCKYTFGHYCDRKDAKNPKCVPVDSKEDCAKTPGCNVTNPTCGSECTPPSPPKFFYCDTEGAGCKGPFDEKGCQADPKCKANKSSSCDPTKCKAQTAYVCDKNTWKCSMTSGPLPPHSYNTSKQCEAACFDNDVSGVWRGLRIDSGYVADEWDFVFGEPAGSVKYRSKAEGKTYTGTYAIGEAMAGGDSFDSFGISIKLEGGDELKGLFDNRDVGPITKFMYLGLPQKGGDAATSYDDAMAAAKQEFVLIACRPEIATCNFSPAKPAARLLK